MTFSHAVWPQRFRQNPMRGVSVRRDGVRLRRGQLASVFVVALVIAACAKTEPVQPEGPFVPVRALTGTFVLTTFRTVSLPLVYGSSTPSSGTTMLIADTLTLRGDGVVRRVTVERFRAGLSACTSIVRENCPTIDTRNASSSGSWGMRRDSLSLRDPLAPLATLAARFGPTGDTLIVTRQGNGALATGDWRYVRQ